MELHILMERFMAMVIPFSGVTIESEGLQKGFFRYIGELGEVSDLNIRGTIMPSGSQVEVGGIAGVNEDTMLVTE